MPPVFSVRPLTPVTWDDFVELMGPNGGCAGCWCMWWHLGRADWTAGKGVLNKRRMRAKVRNGEVPGLIGYLDGTPVAWCSVMPRESFAALLRTRMLRTADRAPAYSVPCFFIAKPYRRRGLAVELLRAAAEYVRRSGGTLVEGYPVIAGKKLLDAFAWTGCLPIFERAGFRVCAKLSESRAIVRLELEPPSPG
jgi:GNAT superfamily N-acetyltransferase